MNKVKSYRILGRRDLTSSTYVLKVEKKDFSFVPGQCVNIGLVDMAVNREYSTYSGINDKYLEFLVKEIPDGVVSPALRKLNKGEEISLDGAYGLFTIQNPDDVKNDYVFIGTGTGIAPFHSFALSYPNLDYKIIHGIRYLNEQYDIQDYPKNRYISCVSRETGGNFHGRVTDYLLEHPVNPNTICYLCGNSEMINEVYEILRGQGVSGTNIITEVFF